MAKNDNPVTLQSDVPFGTNMPETPEAVREQQFDEYLPELSLSEAIPLRYQFRSADITDVNKDILNWAGLGDYNSKDEMEAHELNELLSPKTPFNEKMSLEVATRIAARQKREDAFNFVDSLSPTGSFIGGIAADFLDPKQIAANILTAGTMSYLGIGIKEGAKFGARLATYAAENLVSSAATESLEYASAQKSGVDYTAQQALTNIAAGALMGTAFGEAGFRLGRRMNRSKGIEVDLKKSKTTKAALDVLNGDRVDVSAVETHVKPFISGKAPKEYPQYTFTPISDEQVHTRSFFTSREGAGTSTKGTISNVLSEDLGDGFYFSDDLYVANGTAVLAEAKIFEVTLPENTKLMDLDTAFPEHIINLIKEDLESVDINTENVSGKQLIADINRAINEGQIPETFIEEKIHTPVQEMGYNGFRHTGEMEADGGTQRNVVMLFDDSNIKEVSSTKPDINAVDNKLEIENKITSENKIIYDDTRPVEELVDRPTNDTPRMEVDKAREVVLEDTKALLQQIEGSEKLQSHVDLLLEESLRIKDEEKILNAAKLCVGSS